MKKKFPNRARFHLRRDGTITESQADDAIDLHRFSFSLDDNPYLPAKYVADLKVEYQGLFYKRYAWREVRRARSWSGHRDAQDVRLARTDRLRLFPEVRVREAEQRLVGGPAQQREDLGDGPAAA
ncbi:hypothetical protein ABT084_11340 [Streptomyces sp. NPDC002138]|uniref:hypothetical protein n=1 Tax=Streptomyces sp. NPDC002138 TaxID=3154410 RepID=UPI0033250404